ncbi:thiamine phosphate synthase [Flavobacterium xanthum]|uniref:Thiamine-phosphate pyrophosphorylase n=1 Tax=Flavobacterium xanthum TaxID=69322 RepID=A0A1M7AXP8_9FLAO|nr:thiamine phosphate synthase [Flavobacterium xanthum]SHL47491.1 thiamine-phosphate pyrophosphorylase [Flavobacterium xanthum]
MIIISSPIAIQNEIAIIHSLFQEGMQVFHVRKPDFSIEELNAVVLAIGLEYREHLVLHSHHHLAKSLGIHRIHFTESNRTSINESKLKSYKELDFILSTSTHCIEDFNDLDSNFDYAFLSPVYSSISKVDYAPKRDLFEKIKKRTNFKTKIIGLGGMEASNIQKTIQAGFDDAALLGTIWNQNNPIENFKICQQIVHSY